MTSEPSSDTTKPSGDTTKPSGETARYSHPKHLVKYLSAQAGVSALESHSLMWSSPNRFDSPFEMNGLCEIPFSNNELLEATVKVATSLIFSDNKAVGDTPLIAAINRWRDEDRFESPQEAKTVLKDLLAKMVAQKEEQLHITIKKWQHFVESIRICCFCSSANNTSAWAQFGDNHQGIAISIEPNEENALSHAQPIKYHKERPQLTTIKEQMGSLLYNHNCQPNQRFVKNLLQKPDFLSAEQEWRALSPKDSSFKKTDTPDKDEKMLTPNSIYAIYFGINCSESTKKQALNLIKKFSQKPKCFQCELSKNTYNIEYKTVNTE